MQLICATFRPLFLENICSRLLCNQMIMMLISHFRNILNVPVVFDHIPLVKTKQQDESWPSSRAVIE